MLLQYRSRDFDFGIDAQVVTSLVGGDTSLARSIMKAFSPTSTVVNALSFLSAVVMLSKDLESASPMKTKCDLLFDIFDFHESGDMTLDEVTILLLSVGKAINVVCGTGPDPSDETMEQFTLVMFQSAEKPINGFLTRTEFTTWIMDWVGTEETVDFASVLSRFTPGALITPEQQAAFELQAKLDDEKAEEEARQRRELELKKRLEIEEAARKEAEKKVRLQREKEAAEKRALEEKLQAERKAEEERLRIEEEKRLKEEKKRLEAEHLEREKIEAEERKVEEERLAKEKAEQDAAALKTQQLQRAKTAKAKVATKRAELKKLEEEEKAAEVEAEAQGAEDTLTATLLNEIADTEETNVAATKLQAVQRRKEAKKKVEEKRKELAAAIDEAGKEGVDEGLVAILNDAAEGEEEGKGGEEEEGGASEVTQEEEELEVIKAAQAGRSRTHTVAHRQVAPLIEQSKTEEILEKAADEEEEEKEEGGATEVTQEEEELEKIKAAQAGRSRTHTVTHRQATPLIAQSKMAAEEKGGEGGDATEEALKAKESFRKRTHTVGHSSAQAALASMDGLERKKEEEEGGGGGGRGENGR